MGPLRVSSVLRPDNRVAAGPWVGWAMVVCVLCAAGPNGCGVFYVRLGSLVCVFILGRVFGGCLGAVAWRVLRAGSVGLLLRRRILVEVRTLLCGAYSGCGWGWWRGMFRVSALGFPVCYEVDSSPLFNFNRIFPPFPGACRNLAQKPLI